MLPRLVVHDLQADVRLASLWTDGPRHSKEACARTDNQGWLVEGYVLLLFRYHQQPR